MEKLKALFNVMDAAQTEGEGIEIAETVGAEEAGIDKLKNASTFNLKITKGGFMKLFSLFAVTAFLAAGQVFAATPAPAQQAAAPVANVTDKASGVQFPSEVSFEQGGKQYHLQITGTATRKKFFVKVYSVASYLQDGAPSSGNKFDDFLNDTKAKQLTLKWVHEAPADKVKAQYVESFNTNLTPDEVNRFKPEIDTWLSFFNRDIQKGDEQVVRWIPGGIIEFYVNGQKIGSINNEAFARGLWSLWFGPKTSFDKDSLVSLMK